VDVSDLKNFIKVDAKGKLKQRSPTRRFKRSAPRISGLRATSWCFYRQWKQRQLLFTVLGVFLIGPSNGWAQDKVSELYTCQDESREEITLFGLTVCEATLSGNLSTRIQEENLQTRNGILVVVVENGGIANIAGLQENDLIYRIGGSDIMETKSAITAFNRIRAQADTVINFLRGGRPYRIKVRLE